jgi:electron transport complex protein RnfD
MYDVLLALIPAYLVSVWMFGWGALYVTALSVASCVGFEYLIQRFVLKNKPTLCDGSAVITGVLLAFNVPSNLPPLLLVAGALVAIGVGKMTFGGLGQNIFNPALVGRVFLLISFPVPMTSWPVPQGFHTGVLDAVTGATPLGMVREGLASGESMSSIMANLPDYLDLLVGKMAGSTGEVSSLALLLGGIFLLLRRTITWHIPVSVLVTMALFTGVMHLAHPGQYASPVFHLLTGGALLGALFMATDYVTSPMTPRGMLVYGAGIGVITVLIRLFGAYPEGMSFAILIMNAFVPLLNRYIRPVRFGEEVRHG